MRILAVFLIVILSFLVTSCGAFQLKWDRQVMEHMQTLLTNPDETVLKIVEEWNAQPDMKKGRMVDLDLIRDNVVKLEFDNKKGLCRAYYKPGLDYEKQRVVVGQCMVIFGSLYWLLPDQKRDTVRLIGVLEDTETLEFSWQKGKPSPEIDNDRLQNFI